MTDNQNQRRQEEWDDAALGLLMNEYAEVEGEALWREFQAAEAAGKEAEARKREDRKLRRGSRDQNRRILFLNGFGKCFKRVAVIFLVLLCLLSPAIMSVEAFKIPVLNYIVALEKKFSGFNFGKNEYLTQEQEEVVKLIQSEPCPEGYQFAGQEFDSYGRIWLYFECEGKVGIKVSIYPSEGQINVDTEDIEQIPMKIHEYEAVYLQKEGHRLMWLDAERELIFNLRALELTEDDFWRYAYTLIEKLSQ